MIYIHFGCSCLWFTVGVGKQNIDYYLIQPLFLGNNDLFHSNQGTMAQASLYDLNHLDSLGLFYEEEMASNPNYHYAAFDVVISDYSEAHNLELWTYNPSLVQHIGRASSSSRKNKGKKCRVQHLLQSRTSIKCSICGDEL